MSAQKYKPFHPLGLAGTSGGVVIEDSRIVLVEPMTETVLSFVKASRAPDYRELYIGKKLFDLFPAAGRWYVGKVWHKEATFVIEADNDAFAAGEVVFHGVPAVSSWEARRYYGMFTTWDIQIDLPPDHRIEGDIALQVALAGGVWQLLENEIHRVTGQLKTNVSNYFDKSLFNPLPYLVNRIGQYPTSYLEVVYGWRWHG